MLTTIKNMKFSKKMLSLLFLLTVILLSSQFQINNAVGANDKIAPIQNSTASDLPFRILVKLNKEVASKAESLSNQKKMVFKKESPQNMRPLFDKYKIKKMSPVYKNLVRWKQQTRKSESEYIKRIEKEFPKRTRRSRQGQQPMDISRTYVIEADVTTKAEFDQVLELLKKDPSFEYVEPDLVFTTQMVPNDPYFSTSGTWGQQYSDLYGVKITSSSEAWDTTKGKGITVAVIDTGIDPTHPDLSANLWINEDEIPNNGIDDDINGYVDDTWGWNFVSDDGDNSPVDDHGHGTHVAGTIAAVGNNGIGIIGVAPEAKIMPIKVLNNEGKGHVSTIVDGIEYAVNNGADIINLSLGGPADPETTATIKSAVDNAVSMGVVVVVAAGNDDKDAAGYYPANLNNVITVAATNALDQKAYFSNWGSCIDVAAPGFDILSLRAEGTSRGYLVGDKYTRLHGTSMAAPHVSGVTALILSLHPEFTWDQVNSALRSSATDIMSVGFDIETGYGRINAAKAVQINETLIASIETPLSGTKVTGNLVITGSTKGNNFSNYILEYGKVTEFGKDPSVWNIITQGYTPVEGGNLGSFDTDTLSDGTYIIRLSARDNCTPQNIFYDRVEVVIDSGIRISNPVTPIDPSYTGVIKSGVVVPISGSAIGKTFSRFRMEWAEGLNPTEWYTTGYTLVNGGYSPVENGLLANWDSGVTSGKAGYYQLRLLVNNASFTNEVRTLIYLEPDLASANWPQISNYFFPGNSCILPASTGTGQSSLVGVCTSDMYSGNKTLFMKYSYDGVLQYSTVFNYRDGYNQAAVGDIDSFPGEETIFVKDNQMRIFRNDSTFTEFSLNFRMGSDILDFRWDPIVLQDLDGDSVPEILAVGTVFSTNSKYLYAFKKDGSLLSPKFPILIADNSEIFFEPNYFLVMDINNDGMKEIITQQCQVNFLSSLNVYGWDGTPLAWQSIQPVFSSAVIRKMIASDLDHDGQGEIVLCVTKMAEGFTDDHKIYVVNSDGNIKNGWPYSLNKAYGTRGFEDIAITDMDRDGADEIVYSQTNEINILTADGRPISNLWPYFGTRGYGDFSIGDIDGDGYPELLVFYCVPKTYTLPLNMMLKSYQCTEFQLSAFNRNAQIIKSWTIKGPSGPTKIGEPDDLTIGDFDNNGKIDLAISFPLLINNGTVGGGLSVLTTDGDYNENNVDWPVRFHDPQNTLVAKVKTGIPVAVSGISLNKTSINLAVGESEQLIATVLPSNASNKNVIWSVSSGSNVVAVTQDGTVTANNSGTAVIKATSQADLGKFAECTVTVTVAVSEISLNKTSINLAIGESEQLIATVLPSDASNKNVIWAVSSGSNVVTVTQDGIVTANNSGTAVIKATSQADSGKFAECNVTVTPQTSADSVNEGFENSNTIPPGWSTATVNTGTNSVKGDWSIVSNGTYPTVNAPQSGSKMATFNSYFAGSGWSSRLFMTSGVKLANNSISLSFWMYHDPGYESYQDNIQVQVSVDAGLTWVNVGNAIFRYSATAGWQKHMINLDQYKGTSDFRVAFLAESKWGNNMFLDEIIVSQDSINPITGVTLNKTATNISVGQSEQLTATISPANASNKNIVWSISSQSASNVATVSQDGTVTANNLGTAVIRAASQADPSKYAECTVTVASVQVTGVSLNKTTLTLTVGQSEQLIASILPANAPSQTLLWSVRYQLKGNEAEVTDDGIVTAKNPGTAVIRVMLLSDLTKYAECTLTITPAVTGISLNKTSTSLTVGQSEQLTAIILPENVSNKNIVWSISSQSASNVATVSQDGTVTANNPGTAVIRAASQADPNKYAECTITVTPVQVTGVSLNKTTFTLTVGQSEQLIASILPANAPSQTLIWSVRYQLNGNEAEVTDDGIVTAKNPGTAVIWVALLSDFTKYDECTVTITP